MKKALFFALIFGLTIFMSANIYAAPGNSGNGGNNGQHTGQNGGGSNGNGGGDGGNGGGDGGNDGGCQGNCPTRSSFSGEHAQGSVAFVDQAVIDGNIITGGSQAFASQGTEGSFEGNGNGAGITLGIGITHAETTNKKNFASSVALAGNAGMSAVTGRKSCATLSGSGEAQTVAVKNGGSAFSNGQFEYQGKGAIVVGAGITAGGSFVSTGKNSVTSGAAHMSAAGVVAGGGQVAN